MFIVVVALEVTVKSCLTSFKDILSKVVDPADAWFLFVLKNMFTTVESAIKVSIFSHCITVLPNCVPTILLINTLPISPKAFNWSLYVLPTIVGE